MRWLLLITPFLFSCSPSQEKTLYLFTWSEFFNPEVISRFEKKFDCQVVMDTYDSNESMYAKLKWGAAGYDIIFPSNYYLDILHKQGMILPIDKTAIPNLALLDPKYFKDTEPLVGIPFIVSFSGIAYRQDRIPSPEPTWGVFSRTDLQGRMTMLNDIREAIGAALKYRGYSINSRKVAELEEAGNQLLEWRQNLAKFESEQYKNGLATGEFLIVQGYSSDVMQIRMEDENIQFLFPKEGTILSIDYMAIPQGAQHIKLAYEFINFMIAPENAAETMAFNKSLIPVLSAYELLGPELKKNPILFPKLEDLEKMELIEDLQEDIKIYFDTWERVKGG